MLKQRTSKCMSKENILTAQVGCIKCAGGVKGVDIRCTSKLQNIALTNYHVVQVPSFKFPVL